MAYRLITFLTLLFGLSSIIISLKGDLILSGWLILGTVLLEVAKERISSLGKEIKKFSSFANLISFGIAPLVLIYKNFEKFYLWQIFVLFLYIVCSIVRLTSKENAKGLPLSISSGLLSTTVILAKRHDLDLKIEVFVILMIILNILMVSEIKYPKFQNLENRKAILFLVIGLVLLNILGESLIWFLFFAYILGSPFLIRTKNSSVSEQV